MGGFLKKLSLARKQYLDKHSKRKQYDAAKNFVRKRNWRNSRRRKLLSKKRLSAKRSQIVQLQADKCSSWHVPANSRSLRVPSNFSILHEPQNTIKFLNDLANMGWGRPKTVLGSFDIDQSDVANFDLAANVLLVNLIIALSDEVRNGAMPDLDLGGKLPTDARSQRFLRSIGIPKELNIENQKLPDKILKELIIFKEHIKTPESVNSPYEKPRRDKISENFVKHVNSCLINSGVELTEEGADNLLLSLGEIIDNAELHSGMIDWSLYGYLDTSLETPVFEVTMLNYGYSIAETFKSLPPDSYSWDQMRGYIDKHKKNGLFSTGWNESDLLTVVALQPNISSKNSPSDSTRGHGTVQLLEFFNIVSSFFNGDSTDPDRKSAEMAILSGSTHIYFDGTYRLASKDGRQVIAFNPDNDLSKMPDKNYVRSLGKEFFPGTIVSIKFPLPAGLTETI